MERGDSKDRVAWAPRTSKDSPGRKTSRKGKMKPIFLAVAVILLALVAPGALAQTTATITVTNSSTVVRATTSGYFAVLYEQAAIPTAAFNVTTPQNNGTDTTVSVSVGAAYVFSRPTGSPFQTGDLLGWVASASPGPYNFVLVQYANAPNAPMVSAVKCPTGQSVSQINPDGTTACSPEATGAQSSVMQWNATLNAMVFTAPSGTWSAPVWFTNGSPQAQQSNAGTEMVENTDGQFEIATLANGQLQSLLNLDTDGHVDLYGANGGGISTDHSGNTCLASANGSCWNMVIANNGPLINYEGVATRGGNGLPIILFGGQSPETGNFGPYTLYTTPASGYTANGLFHMSGYIVATAAAPGATLQVRINYTDASGANSQDTGLPIPFGVVGAKLPYSFILQSAPSSSITISIITTNNPTYVTTGTFEAL